MIQIQNKIENEKCKNFKLKKKNVTKLDYLCLISENNVQKIERKFEIHAKTTHTRAKPNV